MAESAKLLSQPVNFAVVHLPSRRFPGVVVQGDTLKGLVRQLDRTMDRLKAGDLQEVAGEVTMMREQLAGALRGYIAVCAENAIATPFPSEDGWP